MSEPPGWATPEAPREDDPVRRGLPPPAGPPAGWGAPPPGWGAPPPGWGPPPPGWGPPPVPPQAGPVQQPPGQPAPYGPAPYGPPPGWQATFVRKPGIVPLRPLTLSEILDGAFQAMRTNPRTMIGIAAAVLTVTSLITVPLQAGLQAWLGSSMAELGEADPLAGVQSILNASVAVLPATLLTQLAVIVLDALLVVAVSSAVLGERTAPGALWRQVRRRVPAAIGLALLTGLLLGVVVTVATAVFAVPSVVLFLNDQPALGVVLALAAVATLIVVAITVNIYLSVAAPALLLEGLGVVRALRRSARLVRGSFWRTLLTLGVSYVVLSLGSAVVSVPVGIATTVIDATSGNVLHTRFPINLLDGTVSAIGQIAAGAVLNPWWAAIVALVYIDLRMRREGLDLELLRAADARETP